MVGVGASRCHATSLIIGNSRASKSSGIGFLPVICFMKKAMPLAARSNLYLSFWRADRRCA
jgi:hypothetical protein